ncbi:MAG: sulfate adenylyltransferase [Opitutaceae bacterium]|nr:sulfate adenylyltransferase [Opitutaceae bacterium]
MPRRAEESRRDPGRHGLCAHRPRDLSKEIPVEKIPFTQKIILNKAAKKGVAVFVATNLLETMVEKRKPTRAEVHDVVNTILDGAYGLALSAETAIGRYPFLCVNMMQRLIRHTVSVVDFPKVETKEDAFVGRLCEAGYLLDREVGSALGPAHGGTLISRMAKDIDPAAVSVLPRIELADDLQMDVEQIAIGTFSPLEGFMNQRDLRSVLREMRLANGCIWPIPVVLDVSRGEAARHAVGATICLVDRTGRALALLELEEKYEFDRDQYLKAVYGTLDNRHPGVNRGRALHPVFLAGKITRLARRASETAEYELTPRQVRRLFEERGWQKVVGFHTRNVIHRSHEFIQLQALAAESCDGLFVQPIVGSKKPGDFQPQQIIRSYETMMKGFYPPDQTFFAVLATWSRYAGPREAVFTAICRKNYGCSHFIVGRDHTGVAGWYEPEASQRIFDRFPDLGIKVVKFGNVTYSKRLGHYVHETQATVVDRQDRQEISGTQARAMLRAGQRPPEWFMRKAISDQIVASLRAGETVFVGEDESASEESPKQSPEVEVPEVENGPGVTRSKPAAVRLAARRPKKRVSAGVAATKPAA